MNDLTAAAPPPVRTRVRAGTGVIELDRPGALNALDLTMVRLITAALERWRDDDAVRSVLVRSTSPKAFCAGGDIVAMRSAGLRGDDEAVAGYFGAEYALNALIARYPKPYTALIDGYAMGGGLGVSVHGSARVVTERASLAMPETGIGFFPDIGASWFLPRLPDAIGWYLGLTGTRISAAAAVECGLATHYVPAALLPALEADLCGGGGGDGVADGDGDAGEVGVGERHRGEGEGRGQGAAWTDPAAVLARYATAAPASELAPHRAAVARCFTAPDLAELRARLTAERTRGDRRGSGEGEDAGSGWAADALAALDRASPRSLALTFELLRAGAAADLEECLAAELRLARTTARSHDFAEGVRAALVDKDRRPVWSPDPDPDPDPEPDPEPGPAPAPALAPEAPWST